MVFLTLVKKGFKSMSAYRVNSLVIFLGGLLTLFVQVSVWRALYAQGQRAESTLEETLTYVLLTTVWLPILKFYPGEMIGNSIYTGELGVDMLRPVNLIKLHLGREIGSSLFRLLIHVIPMTIVAALAFTVLPPESPAQLAAFLASAMFGAVIFMLFDLIVGYAAFWLTANWFVPWFVSAVLLLFGGGMVPIWFYPRALADLTGALPFQYIHYIPINYYLGRLPAEGLWQTLLIQLGWILVFVALERLIWHIAQKKITVQGG